VNAAAMGILLNTSRRRSISPAFTGDTFGKSPEASALLLGETEFGRAHGATGDVS
jgi:hypothetical protein